MSLLEQQTFIKKIHPFDNLNEFELQKLSESLDIIYFKKDELIQNSSSKPEFLYFIIKGVVQELNESEVVTVFVHDQFFDPISLIENHIKHDFVAIAETICYTLSREKFLEIIYKNETIESFFFQSISQKLNRSVTNKHNKEFVNFMIAKVKDAYYPKPLIVDEQISIHQAVTLMVAKKSSSILIRKEGKVGIVTDSDFKEKVVLNRVSFDEPLSNIATFDLISIDSDDFLFNAQLKMNRYGIKRLIVRDKDEEITGVIDLISLTSFFASHTYAMMLELNQAQNIEELKSASKNYIRIIRTLYAKGVKVRYISRLLTQLNSKLFSKLFDLIAPKGLKEQSSFIIMGSEGRGEQILRTDQDNALILSNSCDILPDIVEKFANEFSNHLIDFGYPECSGGIMVNNPLWRGDLQEFKDKIYSWINSPSEENLMNLAIFYDAVSVCGEGDLLDELKEYLYSISNHTQSFHTHFAKSVLSFETPLSLFANFVVSKTHKNELDIKKGGIFAIVHGVRSLSLEYEIESTNTVERLKELNNKKIIDREFTSEIIEAFNFLLTLRLKARLEKIDAKAELDNYINPSKLTILERDLLKESFKIVDKFKKILTYHYKLNIVG